MTSAINMNKAQIGIKYALVMAKLHKNAQK